MEILTGIKTTTTKSSRLNEMNWQQADYGKTISDHMLVCVYDEGAWGEPQILPYGDLQLSPATLALHYGQSIFEGMKAFRTSTGAVNIFRIADHHKRLNRSLQRMCMPQLPAEIFIEGLQQLIDLDRSWVPEADGSALYIRPFVFASEARLGLKVSDRYHFIVFTGPVRPLYEKPIRVKVEREYIRAARGGTGYAKCAGNYGGAFYPTQLAKQQGYDQVLWTDAKENEFIEESGTMNVMFVLNGKLVTPPVSDSILDGITRDSLLEIARGMGVPVQERAIGATELKYAFRNGTITEAFGAGTAAVVAPIAAIGIDGVEYELPLYNSEALMYRLRARLDAMRYGRSEDLNRWNYLV